MERQELLENLEKHLRKVESENNNAIYTIKLRVTINSLKSNLLDDEQLIAALQSLGFHDLARKVRKDTYNQWR